jgi:hypothetical protein
MKILKLSPIYFYIAYENTNDLLFLRLNQERIRNCEVRTSYKSVRGTVFIAYHYAVTFPLHQIYWG